MTAPPARNLIRQDLLGAGAAGLVVALFSLLLLAHDGRVFWHDDYQISILPVFADVARSWSEGHWPLLSPYSWVCSNLAGEFQYGTFSVFVNAAVVLIWKFPLGFAQQAAALSIVHLVALAMGSYMLARGRELSAPLALMVSLVTALNGWMICWGASDWFGALAAFAWLPWSWWALERAVRADGPRWRLLLPAPFIYLLITGGFPYTVLMLGLVTAWLALRALVSRDVLGPMRLAVGWVLGLGLSAPAWIALLEYSSGSRRAVEVFKAHQWTVPFSAWPGLLLPSWVAPWRMFNDFAEAHAGIELACGLVPVVILVAALISNGRAVLAELRWEFALLMLVLAMCMIPSAGMFRFSFRSLALFHVVLALASAEAFRIWSTQRAIQSTRGFARLGSWALLLIASTWIAASLGGLKFFQSAVSLQLIFLLIALLWRMAEALRTQIEPWLLSLVTALSLFVTYLTLPTHSHVSHFGFQPNLNDAYPLDTERLYLSLYTCPTENYRGETTNDWFGTVFRPGSTSMFAGIHLINGYSPVGPAGIARLLDFGTPGHINPPLIAEVVLPEAGPGGLLEQLGIDGLLVAHDVTLPARLPGDWQSVYYSWEGEVFHRDVIFPQVRALPDDQFTGAGVRMIENSRQRVIAEVTPAEAHKPARLTFSRPYFPGYRATLNGRALTVSSLRGLAPTVEIPAGESGRLELVYRPRAVTLGGGIAAVSLLAAAATLVLMKRRAT